MGSYEAPVITIVIPSLNQGKYLEQTLSSIFQQNIPVEVFLMDGGSSDETLKVIEKWSSSLAGWRSYPDKGQAAAINEGISLGSAPYVCWINSDDWVLPKGLLRLWRDLELRPNVAFAYGYSKNYNEDTKKFVPVWVEQFSEKRLALRCIISQPSTLIRREAWNFVGGVNEDLIMVFDYDLWWRLYKEFGSPILVKKFISINRVHFETKTNKNRVLHYREAMSIVKKHHGTLPLKWTLYKPYSVWYKFVKNFINVIR
jgi:glycosyltransferase involved in cell wall biosynthesis